MSAFFYLARFRMKILPLAFALALSGGMLPSPLRAEPASDPALLALYIVPPARPGQLTECRLPTAGDAVAATWAPVTTRVTLAWHGGSATLNPQADAPASGARLAEHCFRLDLDGKPLVSGAIVSRHSARLLTFPVLLEESGPHRPAELTLSPSLPPPNPPEAAPGMMPPWLQTLQARFPHGSAPR